MVESTIPSVLLPFGPPGLIAVCARVGTVTGCGRLVPADVHREAGI